MSRNKTGRATSAAPTDDFDTPMKFVAIQEEANIYGDSHRYLFQFVLQRHGALKVKQFWTQYIYISTCLAKKNPLSAECVQCTKEQLMELSETLIKKINLKIEWMMMELRLVKAEYDGAQWVCLINQHCYHEDLIGAAGLKPDEAYLFTKWLEYVFANDSSDGSISTLYLTDMACDLPNSISGNRVQAILDKLLVHNWIKKVNDGYELTPRAIAELENIIRNKFGPQCCALCLRIIVKKSIAISCTCGITMHNHCYEEMVNRPNAKQGVSCPGDRDGCKTIFTKGSLPRTRTEINRNVEAVNRPGSEHGSSDDEE